MMSEGKRCHPLININILVSHSLSLERFPRKASSMSVCVSKVNTDELFSCIVFITSVVVGVIYKRINEK